MKQIYHLLLDAIIVAIIITSFNTVLLPINPEAFDSVIIMSVFAFGAAWFLLSDHLDHIRDRILHQIDVARRVLPIATEPWIHPGVTGFKLAILSALMSPLVPMVIFAVKVPQWACIQATEAQSDMITYAVLAGVYHFITIVRILSVIKPKK